MTTMHQALWYGAAEGPAPGTFLIGAYSVPGTEEYQFWYSTIETVGAPALGVKVDSATIAVSDLNAAGPIAVLGQDLIRVYFPLWYSGWSGTGYSLKVYDITLSTGAYQEIAAIDPEQVEPITAFDWFHTGRPLRGITDVPSYMHARVSASPGDHAVEYHGPGNNDAYVVDAPSGVGISSNWKYCRDNGAVVLGLTKLYRYGNTCGAPIVESAALGDSIHSVAIIGTDVYAAMVSTKTVRRFDLATLTQQEVINRPYQGGGTDVYACLFNCFGELGLMGLPSGSFGESSIFARRSGAWVKFGDIDPSAVGNNSDVKSYTTGLI